MNSSKTVRNSTTGLNPQQKSARNAPKAPLLIVAGAGTGKTRTLVSRLAYFIEQGVEPGRICAITFTNKAAKEMASRVVAATIDHKQLTIDGGADADGRSNVKGQMSDVGRSAPFIGTFHALGAKILRNESRLLGRKKGFAIFDDRDSFDLVKKAVQKLLPKRFQKESAKLKKDTEKPAFFAAKISELKNVDGALERLKVSPKPADALLLSIFLTYENALKENNAFDFDDLIEKPVQLFMQHPEVLATYQSMFDAILVDEYQDISPKQYALIKLLAGSHKNVSVVGDDEQLIYGWRYADLETFLNFEKDWPGAHVALLEENYRSTGNIINAAAAVVKQNAHRREKTLWTKNQNGAPIVIAELADEDNEAEWIANEIAATHDKRLTTNDKNNPASVGSRKLSVGSQSTAILYRTNAQSRALEQALIRYRIPYHIFGGLKFYERREVKDVVAALRYAVNRNDSLARERLEKNVRKAAFGDFEAALGKMTTEKSTPLGLIELFLKTTDYIGYLERNFTNHEERGENIAELVGFAGHFDDLETFLEQVALVQSTDAPSGKRHAPESKEVVHLMTIHLAKGLEFDRVFIAGAAEGILPHNRSLEDDARLEEERRLMYVAMTRARKELAISFYDLPSRFISEIPQEFVRFDQLSSDEKFSDGNIEDVYWE